MSPLFGSLTWPPSPMLSIDPCVEIGFNLIYGKFGWTPLMNILQIKYSHHILAAFTVLSPKLFRITLFTLPFFFKLYL